MAIMLVLVILPPTTTTSHQKNHKRKHSVQGTHARASYLRMFHKIYALSDIILGQPLPSCSISPAFLSFPKCKMKVLVELTSFWIHVCALMSFSPPESARSSKRQTGSQPIPGLPQQRTANSDDRRGWPFHTVKWH